MKLGRFAVITLAREPRQAHQPFTLSTGAIDVHLNHATGGEWAPGTRWVAHAITTIGRPQLDANGDLLVPANERAACESAISVAGDLLSVVTRRGRAIASPTPPVAFLAEDEEDSALLQRARIIRQAGPRGTTYFETDIPFSPEIAAAMNDRWDGVTLLAEANAQTSAAGKFRDYARLFEAAFSVPFVDLDKKLQQTLHPGMGYTREEIRSWTRLRHPFSHADFGRPIAVEADARPIVLRMEQAALDILFNKALWRSNSRNRRMVWIPPAMTTGLDTPAVVRQGTAMNLETMLLDEFGVFPRAFETVIPAAPQWWWRLVPQEPAVRDSGRDEAP